MTTPGPSAPSASPAPASGRCLLADEHRGAHQRLGCLGHVAGERLIDVPELVSEIEAHVDAGRLVPLRETDRVRQQDLVHPGLDQGGRVPRRIGEQR
jgi:hypothetical protein